MSEAFRIDLSSFGAEPTVLRVEEQREWSCSDDTRSDLKDTSRGVEIDP